MCFRVMPGLSTIAKCVVLGMCVCTIVFIGSTYTFYSVVSVCNDLYISFLGFLIYSEALACTTPQACLHLIPVDV